MHTTQTLIEEKLLTCNLPWLSRGIAYEVQMGSTAYGVANDDSDVDLYGFVIPPLEAIFPHLNGEIMGFGTPKTRFEQFQAHNVQDPTSRGGKGRVYDLTIYSIVKFFQLAMQNNPNMVDALFVPQTCVLRSTGVGQFVRSKRHLFLHKGAFHKFKGYAYSQLNKMRTKKPTEESNRREDYLEYGFDVKAGYHCVRLLLQIEQILIEHDLDLQRHREQLKAIRRGEWTLERIQQFFTDKESELEKLYVTSKLQARPDETLIKCVLLECLEDHYGSLAKIRSAPVELPGAHPAFAEIKAICERMGA